MNNSFSDDSDWDELLDFIAEKQLTPVIGTGMYMFKSQEESISFETYISRKILEVYKVSDLPPATLAGAVSYLETERREKPMDITRKLKSILKDINFEFPLLAEFSKIQELNYFINTTVYNNLFEDKLNASRIGNINSINFSINEPFPDSGDLDRLQEPFVFNLFGSLLDTVDPALSEEDMLEFTGDFKEKMKNAPNILNALKNKNLLFIGCTFPDWLIRFCLRLISNEPLSEWGSKRSVLVVNDQSELTNTEFAFLKNYDVSIYQGNTPDFINELSKRWKKRSPQTVKNKMVFLSYTIKDKEAVETLKKAIESIGNINCWYDGREIIAGDDFKTEIAKNIKSADLFIPLISANSLLHMDGYVQKEWFTADNVNTFRKIDGNTGKFLMPVVIDDTNPYDASVPKYFSELSIGKVPQGNPSPDFITKLKETLGIAG